MKAIEGSDLERLADISLVDVGIDNLFGGLHDLRRQVALGLASCLDAAETMGRTVFIMGRSAITRTDAVIAAGLNQAEPTCSYVSSTVRLASSEVRCGVVDAATVVVINPGAEVISPRPSA